MPIEIFMFKIKEKVEETVKENRVRLFKFKKKDK